MATVLSYKDIESIAISQLVEQNFVVTNTGLSAQLIEELSADISTEFLVELIRIQAPNGTWYTYTNDPTELKGIDEQGKPVYGTTWNGEEWLYLPFRLTMNSVKSSGEIVGGSIEINNNAKEISSIIDATDRALPVKIYILSGKTMQCVWKDEYKFITSTVNSGTVIQASPAPADVLGEPCPALTYNAYNFRK